MMLQELPLGASILVVLIAYVLPLSLCALEGYLLGSVNSSIILTRLLKKGDIREKGSGNAGMTNMLRSVGKLPALITFIGDFVKCVAAVLLAWGIMRLLDLSGGMVNVGKYTAGVFCVLGHIFPLYFGFKGGKGIVTSAAMIALLDWRVFLLILATFLLVFVWKGIVSLASVVCAGLYPVYTFVVTFLFDFSGGPLAGPEGCSLPLLLFSTLCSLFIGGLVLFMHRGNIGRLRRGEEKPVWNRKKK